jgi:uncharacterized protein
MKALIQLALHGYKRWVSPMMPNACRFVPTCSEYAFEAVERHGALRGSWLAAGRLLRCHPFARAGYDPVPVNRRSSHRIGGFRVVPQSLAGGGNACLTRVCGHQPSAHRNP